MARVGILGGTFNPPHVAHLVCASEAASQLRLDRVLLTPVAVPPHKRPRNDPGASERLELCRLAAAGDERLEVCDLEVARGGPSYTVQTLRELRARMPGDELTFILGADVALGLPSWREPEVVIELATLAVAERAGAARAEIEACLEQAFGGRAAYELFDMPRIDVSSSEIRRRVAEGRPIRYLVPDAVLARIERNGLYR
ncbi:MAG: nicotinate-nucleotide adenylyltransferase [Solirubrobacteraceae bacterium]|nr:nicotinate-nucleotide adenylyltransferase [Solirubrobacteraceae bacterium]